MKTAHTLLALAASTLLATLALPGSAHADEAATSVAPSVEAKPALAPASPAACTVEGAPAEASAAEASAVEASAVEASAVEAKADASERSRVRRRNVGVGLTIGGIAAGVASVPLIVVGASELSSCDSSGWAGSLSCLEPSLITTAGVSAAGIGVSLLSVGIPLWAANAGEATPSSAEVGIGPGSIELRGSF